METSCILKYENDCKYGTWKCHMKIIAKIEVLFTQPINFVFSPAQDDSAPVSTSSMSYSTNVSESKSDEVDAVKFPFLMTFFLPFLYNWWWVGMSSWKKEKMIIPSFILLCT